ncbi:MAG: MFS transporter [Firmicutes bacterium]|nr:MFS transporter [Bacillota bacterium]
MSIASKPEFRNLPETLQDDLKLSVREGAVNTVFATLIGGTFLVGFALELGATTTQIGILSALPPLLNLVQILGSYFVTKVGSSKRVCVLSAALYRLVWVLITLLPLILFWTTREWGAVLILIACLAVASLFASLSGVAWMTWITQMVPESVRGRFFGHRNMVAGAVGMVASLAAAQFIDGWQRTYTSPTDRLLGFSLLFGIGLAFGLRGLMGLRRISDVPLSQDSGDTSFWQELRRPLQDQGFRRWIMFSTVWGFAVGVGSPFFSVYMLENLNLQFSVIAILGLVNGITNTLGMRLWGNLIDEMGSKPLLAICSVGGAVIPFLWVLTGPGNWGILWVTHFFNGLAWSGIGLASSQLLMSTAPEDGASMYFAVFAAITGIAGTISPLLGGALSGVFASLSWQVGHTTLSGLQLLFILTGSLRLLSLTLLRPVPSPQEMSLGEVLSKVRQLSPLQGLRSHQQLTAVGLQAVENTFFHIAEGSLQSERHIQALLDRGFALTHYVKETSEKVEESIDRRLTRWERFLDMLISPLVRAIRALWVFLAEPEDRESDRTHHQDRRM